MDYALTFLSGVIVGAVCLFVCLMVWRETISKRAKAAAADLKKARDNIEALTKREADFHRWAEGRQTEFLARDSQLTKSEQSLKREQEEFAARKISYSELWAENGILKRDLQNIDVNLYKVELDAELRQKKQAELEERSNSLAKKYLDETVKAVVSAIGPNNFSACKQRLLDVIVRCRNIGYTVSGEDEQKLLSKLKEEFELAVRAAFEREEQARIKAQIREEERLKREIERELKQLDRERAAIQAALDQALAEAKGQHSAQVEELQRRLAEAEEKSKRAISMAQQTKSGHVYVISNVGSFGKNVFKVGMTRRLEPKERVDELGSASVPFPYDVHMMIRCDDAPKLENAIHRALHKHRINKANPRKEFFKAEIESILEIVRKNHSAEVEYRADPEALEYNQSLTMPDEDAQYVEKVFDAFAKDEENTVD
jgi:hypothetical protein